MKPIVKVIWADSQDHKDSWVDEDDAVEFGEKSCNIISIGFLISKGPKNVTLGADWDEEDKDYGRVTKIPTSMILSIEEIPIPSL